MTKPSPPLFASLAKVKSAYSKIAELSASINAFLAGAKTSIRSETYEGRTYVIGGMNRAPDEGLSLKAGEVAVQLRDALDKMAVALIIQNGRGTSGVHFPFGGMDKATRKIEPFPSARHRHLEKKFTPEQWKLILAQKPHPRGNDTLWAVNQIANCDKHWEGLVEVKINPMLDHLSVANGYFHDFAVYPSWPEGLVRQHETERVLLAWAGPMPDAQGRAGVGIVFGEIPPVTGRDVLVSLNSQAAEVERIVQLFLKTFF